MAVDVQTRPPVVPAPPEHAVEIPGTPGWSTWRWMAVRSSGFPSARIAVLRDPVCEGAALGLLAAESRRGQAAAAALAAANGALDALRESGDWTTSPRKSGLLDARNALKADRKPKRAPDDPSVLAALVELWAAEQAELDARASYEDEYRAATARTSAVISELASDDLLAEAILWQNRAAFHSAVMPLRRRAGAPGSRNNVVRQHEELLVRYFMRYSVKNDTIGFFGPFGWARLGDGEEPLAARCGDVIGERMVFFEQWAVDAVTDTLAAQPALDPWTTPRKLPFAHLDGATLYPLQGSPVQLSAAEAAALAASDGRRPAHRIAADLATRDVLGLDAPEDVYACLDQLRSRGLIVWRLEAPYVARPEVALRQTLEGIGDAQLRATTLRTLDLFEAARDGVVEAAGDLEALDRALGVMDKVFERLTGQAPVRGLGRMHVGRAVLFEDCIRDLDVTLGRQALEALGPPVTLILQSARWLTQEIAARYRETLHGLYEQLVVGDGAAVRVADLWPLLPEHFAFLSQDAPEDSDLIADAKREMQRRWLDALGLEDLAVSEHRVPVAGIDDRIRAAFHADSPGWSHARYMSIDVFIAAEEVSAVNAGDYEFVLGEVHLANNTLGASDFIEAHPEPATVRSYPAHDLPEPCVVSVPSRRWRGMTSRTRGTLTQPHDFHVLISHEFPSEPLEPAQQLALAELVIEPRDGELIVRTYDGRLEREIVEFFGELISISMVDAFRIFAGLPHVPRITVGRLVLQRESWSFPARELEFAEAATDADRFREARRWAREQGLPDAGFVSLPLEQKPIYVDFASPILVEVFARMIRRGNRAEGGAGRITLSELLPTLDQLWLTDPQGNRYTSELRIVAVDRD